MEVCKWKKHNRHTNVWLSKWPIFIHRTVWIETFLTACICSWTWPCSTVNNFAQYQLFVKLFGWYCITVYDTDRKLHLQYFLQCCVFYTIDLFFLKFHLKYYLNIPITINDMWSRTVHTFNVPTLCSIFAWCLLFTAETFCQECKIILTHCWLIFLCFRG